MPLERNFNTVISPNVNEYVIDVVWTVLHTSVCNYKPYDDTTNIFKILMEKGKEIISKYQITTISAWYIKERVLFLRELKNWFKERSIRLRRKIKGLLKSLTLIYLLYKDTLERYYLPGNNYEKQTAFNWSLMNNK